MQSQSQNIQQLQSSPTPQTTSTKLGEISSLQLNQVTQILYYKNPIILNQQYTHDIIPGVYEGGFQLWQCEVQFLRKMFQLQHFAQLISGKSVIQIGCGHGLLAIAADKLNAKCITLQDYNLNVIQELTQPTVVLNDVKTQVKYLSGDWDSIRLKEEYDIILGSQLTYREENYSKIIGFIKNNMKLDGRCILANKSFYFGVGGNLAGFKTLLQENGLLWKSLSKIVPKSGGNKKEIIEIYFNTQK